MSECGAARIELNETYRAQPGSDLYYSLLYTPQPQRLAAETLHAFAREVIDIPRTCSDPGVARLKLQWWREELARTFAGEPRHPLGKALHAVDQTLALDIEHFKTFVGGVETVLHMVAPPSAEALTAFHQAVAGSLWRSWTAINGGDVECKASATALAVYVERAATLRNLRVDLAAGFCKLDAAQLADRGVSHEQLAAFDASPSVTALLQVEVAAIRKGLKETLLSFPAKARVEQVGLLIFAKITQATLQAYESAGCPFLESRISLTPLRKLWIAWRTKRRQR